jgi:two-component system phosphate regulon sensor histidine kinase PhoR
VASLAPERVGPPSSGTALTVLLAEPDVGALVAVGDELTRRGFVVIPVTTWAAALTVVEAGQAHIIVADAELAELTSLVRLQSGASESADRSRDSRDTPFIFMVDDVTVFDWDSYALLGSADYAVGPFDTADLGQRVAALALRLQRREAARLQADRLRAAARRVTEAIQSTNEPAVLGSLLVSGAADVFDLRQVSLVTFDDDRVARLGLQVQDGRLSPEPPDLGEHESAVKELATRLWRSGEAIDMTQPVRKGVPEDSPELAAGAAALGDHVSLALPLGNGTSAFGLLWVTSSRALRVWSTMEVSLLRHVTGVAAQALMQARIISGQQEVLQRLQRLDDAKSSFLRTVNHELRTPLTSMTAYLDLLRDGAGGELPSGAVNMLTVVGRNAVRLKMLVDDVLTISRMTADPQVVWDSVNVSQLVTTVVSAFEDAATAKGVRLELADFPLDLMVEGDGTRLKLVCRNVTDNAIKFTPAGGRVQLDVAHCLLGSVPAVSIVVADNGTGVPEEDLPEVFTSFYRGSNAEAGAVSGSGLGLAIVRGVVDSHGGTVEVSETAGGGTTIRVQLPVSQQPPQQQST